MVKILTHLKKRMTLSDEALRNYVLYSLLLDTGARMSEALHIKIDDINFENRSIHLKHTKTNTERYVFYTKNISLYLKKMIMLHNFKDFIFMNYRQHKRLSVDNVQKISYRLKKRLESNKSISLHRWRHTFVTNFSNKGDKLETLRQKLGHASIKTTQIYLHSSPDELHKEYLRINPEHF